MNLCRTIHHQTQTMYSSDESEISFDLDVSSIPSPRSAPQGPPRKLLRPLGDGDFALSMDWTSISNLLSCPRKAEFNLIHSRTSFPGPALAYGQSVHKALESWYLNLDKPLAERFQLALGAGEAHQLLNPPPPGEWRDREQLEKTIAAYAKTYPKEPFEVLTECVERPFELQLGEIEVDAECLWPYNLVTSDSNPENNVLPFYIRKILVQWTGVVDLLLRQHGELWTLDHKTSSRGGPSYFQGFEQSEQFIGYSWAAQKIFNVPIRGCALNAIFGRKPTKTGRGVDLERRFYEYTPERIEEWRFDMLEHCTDLIRYLMKGHFPINSTSCVGKYGTCEFLPVCNQPMENRGTLLMSDNYCTNIWDPLDERR